MSGETIATGYLRLVPSVDGIQGALGNQMASAGQSGAKRFSKGFLPSMKGLLAAAGGALLAREVKQFVGEGIAALSRIQTINAQTASVIKSTGGASNVSAAQVEKLANALERTTATEAESIQEGANLLLTFKNIRNEAGKGNDIFNQTVTSMVDLSRAMGTDAKGGAIQLGKALNDPVKGIAALTRVGITFSDAQKTMIKRLVESGDVMGAQKIILAELNSQFGGSGAAFAETYAGKVALIDNEFGNLQESLLSGIMPTLGKFQDLTLLVLDKINGSKALKSFIGRINTIGDGAVGNLDRVIEVVDRLAASDEGITFEGLKKGLPELAPFLSVAEAIAPLLPAVAAALSELGPSLAPAIPVIADLVGELLPTLTDLLVSLLPLVPPLVQLITSMQDVGKELRIFEMIGEAAGFLAEATQNTLGMADALFEFLGAAEKTPDSVRKFIDALLGAKGPTGDLLRTLAPIATTVGDLFRSVTRTVERMFSTTVRNVKSFVNDVIRAVNSATSGINGFASVLSKATGIKVGSIPQIPLLAKGGTATRAGWAVVGDAGPELMHMTPGATVVPLPKGGGESSEERIYFDGGQLFGTIRRLANGEARLVLNAELESMARTEWAGGVA